MRWAPALHSCELAVACAASHLVQARPCNATPAMMKGRVSLEAGVGGKAKGAGGTIARRPAARLSLA